MTDYTVEARRAWAVEQVALFAVPEPNTGCYLWTGRTSGIEGYAAAKVGTRTVRIGRALLGLTDQSVFACHTCDTPACVNEQHLFAGTARTNLHDARDKGRLRRSHCKHGHAFTPENVVYDKHYRIAGTFQRRCRICTQAKSRRLTAVRRARKSA